MIRIFIISLLSAVLLGCASKKLYQEIPLSLSELEEQREFERIEDIKGTLKLVDYPRINRTFKIISVCLLPCQINGIYFGHETNQIEEADDFIISYSKDGKSFLFSTFDMTAVEVGEQDVPDLEKAKRIFENKLVLKIGGFGLKVDGGCFIPVFDSDRKEVVAHDFSVTCSELYYYHSLVSQVLHKITLVKFEATRFDLTLSRVTLVDTL